ncbi:hypothetical protein LXL04_016682 [Taraxacum kok-saghyz]
MSVNKLTGKLPKHVCRLPKLQVLPLYNNSLTGDFGSVGEVGDFNHVVAAFSHEQTVGVKFKNVMCIDLSYFLEGNIPEGIPGPPSVSIIDLSYNFLNGSITKSIGILSSASPNSMCSSPSPD